MSAWGDLQKDLAVCSSDPFERIAVVLLRASRGLPTPLAQMASLTLRLVCGAHIPRSVIIGSGVRFPHGGQGVVIYPAAILGENIEIFQGVTIGVRDASLNAPLIEDNVVIYPGAVVVGGIVVGDGARIGANAVVRRDVPSAAIVSSPEPNVRLA